MGAQLAQMGMGVADTVMAGRYGSEDLAGVALGSSILWPTFVSPNFVGVEHWKAANPPQRALLKFRADQSGVRGLN